MVKWSEDTIIYKITPAGYRKAQDPYVDAEE